MGVRRGKSERSSRDAAPETIAELVRRATDLLGDESAAAQWLRTPAPALGGATPMDYATTDFGARDVIRWIGRLEHGIPT